jgi:hypothetical protein
MPPQLKNVPERHSDGEAVDDRCFIRTYSLVSTGHPLGLNRTGPTGILPDLETRVGRSAASFVSVLNVKAL